jgi:hypothetical protein
VTADQELAAENLQDQGLLRDAINGDVLNHAIAIAACKLHAGATGDWEGLYESLKAMEAAKLAKP